MENQNRLLAFFILFILISTHTSVSYADTHNPRYTADTLGSSGGNHDEARFHSQTSEDDGQGTWKEQEVDSRQEQHEIQMGSSDTLNEPNPEFENLWEEQPALGELLDIPMDNPPESPAEAQPEWGEETAIPEQHEDPSPETEPSPGATHSELDSQAEIHAKELAHEKNPVNEVHPGAAPETPGGLEPYVEPESEDEPEPHPEPESQSEEHEEQFSSKPEHEAQPEPETHARESDTEDISEIGMHLEPEAEPEAEPEPSVGSEPHVEPESKPEHQPEPENQSEFETLQTDAHDEPELPPEPEPPSESDHIEAEPEPEPEVAPSERQEVSEFSQPEAEPQAEPEPETEPQPQVAPEESHVDGDKPEADVGGNPDETEALIQDEWNPKEGSEGDEQQSDGREVFDRDPSLEANEEADEPFLEGESKEPSGDPFGELVETKEESDPEEPPAAAEAEPLAETNDENGEEVAPDQMEEEGSEGEMEPWMAEMISDEKGTAERSPPESGAVPQDEDPSHGVETSDADDQDVDSYFEPDTQPEFNEDAAHEDSFKDEPQEESEDRHFVGSDREFEEGEDHDMELDAGPAPEKHEETDDAPKMGPGGPTREKGEPQERHHRDKSDHRENDRSSGHHKTGGRDRNSRRNLKQTSEEPSEHHRETSPSHETKNGYRRKRPPHQEEETEESEERSPQHKSEQKSEHSSPGVKPGGPDEEETRRMSNERDTRRYYEDERHHRIHASSSSPSSSSHDSSETDRDSSNTEKEKKFRRPKKMSGKRGRWVWIPFMLTDEDYEDDDSEHVDPNSHPEQYPDGY